MTRKMKAVVKRYLLQSNNIKRDSYVWNAFSAMINSFQTFLLLLVITRIGTDEDSGIFVMAYAVGNLMLCIGKYGIRQYQVTDVLERYSYRSYIHSRIVSVCLMLGVSLLYCGINYMSGGYSAKKSAFVLLICLMKAIEAAEDVVHGRLQQMGRLDIAGKIQGTRLLIFILCFGFLFAITNNLILTALISIGISLLISIYLNRTAIEGFVPERQKGQVDYSLLHECLPLCLATALNMYIANAPKYIIDKNVTDSVQTAYNIVFMPVFVMALLGNFIFQPQLKQLGELWAERSFEKLVSLIKKLSVSIVVVDIAAAIAAYYIGCPLLGIVYHYDLNGYQFTLFQFMLAGGVIALHNLFIMVIAAIRKQKLLLYGYFAVASLLVVSGTYILDKGGLTALNLFYLCTLLLLLMIMIAITAHTLKTESGEPNEKEN